MGFIPQFWAVYGVLVARRWDGAASQVTNENAPDSVESLGRSLNSPPPKPAHYQPNGCVGARIWLEWATLENRQTSPERRTGNGFDHQPLD
jgi:hypothetical protein